MRPQLPDRCHPRHARLAPGHLQGEDQDRTLHADGVAGTRVRRVPQGLPGAAVRASRSHRGIHGIGLGPRPRHRRAGGVRLAARRAVLRPRRAAPERPRPADAAGLGVRPRTTHAAAGSPGRDDDEHRMTSTGDQVLTRLRRLESTAEISAIPARYCRSVDSRDLDSFAALWADDARWTFGETLYEGVPALCAMVEREAWRRFSETMHFSTNLVASIDHAGTRAEVVWDVNAITRVAS